MDGWIDRSIEVQYAVCVQQSERRMHATCKGTAGQGGRSRNGEGITHSNELNRIVEAADLVDQAKLKSLFAGVDATTRQRVDIALRGPGGCEEGLRSIAASPRPGSPGPAVATASRGRRSPARGAPSIGSGSRYRRPNRMAWAFATARSPGLLSKGGSLRPVISGYR